MLALGSRDGRMWWAFPPLMLTSRYYASTIPGRVLEALAGIALFVEGIVHGAQHCRDVSFSYLWVEAFPGIEWSQSFGEMLEYAVSRVRPDAEPIGAAPEAADTQAWAVRGQWSRLSQGRRILRWITRASDPPGRRCTRFTRRWRRRQ